MLFFIIAGFSIPVTEYLEIWSVPPDVPGCLIISIPALDYFDIWSIPPTMPGQTVRWFIIGMAIFFVFIGFALLYLVSVISNSKIPFASVRSLPDGQFQVRINKFLSEDLFVGLKVTAVTDKDLEKTVYRESATILRGQKGSRMFGTEEWGIGATVAASIIPFKKYKVSGFSVSLLCPKH